MQVTLNIKSLNDLEILRPIFERLEITVLKPIEPIATEAKPKLLPLSNFINTIPSLDISSFEQFNK